MDEPNYKRPFDQTDFRGYFRWTLNLTRRIGGYLYHACHEDELEQILASEALDLRSEWSLRLPRHGLWSAPGTWTGLNYFLRGNYYGPCVIKFPLRVLNGKHFVVFRRTGPDRHRYFFVQYEARLPIYSYDKQSWRNVKPDFYFTTHKKRLSKRPGAIYDIVITQPIPLDDVEIIGVDHPECIPGKWKGCSAKQSNKMVRRLAVADWRLWMTESTKYSTVMKRFPVLDGALVKLFDPSDAEDE